MLSTFAHGIKPFDRLGRFCTFFQVQHAGGFITMRSDRWVEACVLLCTYALLTNPCEYALCKLGRHFICCISDMHPPHELVITS